MYQLIEKQLEKSRNVKKRYEWLDIIKAICIISVVMFHIEYQSSLYLSNSIFEYLRQVAGGFEVTIFYCVAGITLNNDKLKNTFMFLAHKFKNLYLKLLFLGIGAVTLHNVFINIGFYKLSDFSYYSTKDIFISIIKAFFFPDREVVLGACWFVYSLIICFFILAIIEFLINKLKFIKNKREFRLFITFSFMFVSIIVSSKLNITIPRFSHSFVGLFLLDFTNFLYINNKLDKCNIYLFLACLINLLLAPLFGKISMNSNTITSPYYLIVVVMSALYLLIFLSKKMENKKIFNFLKYIGKKSFSIMVFHFIGFKIGGVLLNILGITTDISLLVPNAYNIIYLTYYLTFGIVVSLVISYFLENVLKFKL